MENFFIDDYFCTDISDLMSHLDIEEEDVKDLDEDWCIKVEETTLEKVYEITERFVVEALQDRLEAWEDDRLPEDAERVIESTAKAIRGGIDVAKINDAMPSLYYPNGKITRITKTDLLEYIN